MQDETAYEHCGICLVLATSSAAEHNETVNDCRYPIRPLRLAINLLVRLVKPLCDWATRVKPTACYCLQALSALG